MMTLLPETERAIEMCYDAAVSTETWAYALDQLACSLGADASLLLAHGAGEGGRIIARSTQSYALDEYWKINRDWATDIYAERAVPLARAGHKALIESQIFSDDELRTSRFHREIARPSGLEHWSSSCFAVETRTRCLVFFRGKRPFIADDARRLAEVSPRMAKVVNLAEKVSYANAAAGVVILERLACAAMLVDGRGFVRQMNRHAEALLGDDFRICEGKPWTSDCRQAARLSRLLASGQIAMQRGEAPIEPVVISRNGFPWLLLDSIPLTSMGVDVFGAYGSLLIISDLTQSQVSGAKLLSMAFGLTWAEARLVDALCKGNDLNSAAVKIGVARQTLRSQLKAIFHKTGCSRQADLVALAGRIKAPSPD